VKIETSHELLPNRIDQHLPDFGDALRYMHDFRMLLDLAEDLLAQGIGDLGIHPGLYHALAGEGFASFVILLEG
jgi:hypothetical protein